MHHLDAIFTYLPHQHLRRPVTCLYANGHHHHQLDLNKNLLMKIFLFLHAPLNIDGSLFISYFCVCVVGVGETVIGQETVILIWQQSASVQE